METEGVEQTQKQGSPNPSRTSEPAPYAEFAISLGWFLLLIGFLAPVVIIQSARDYEMDGAISFAIASFLFGFGAFVILTVLGEIGKNIAEIKKNSAKNSA